MPRTRECDYCGDDIEPGTGTMFVRKDGSTVHFCSSKCENNADLGREARNLEWTEAGGAPDEEAVADQETTESESGEDVTTEDEDVQTETEEDVEESESVEAESADEGNAEEDEEEAEA